MRDTFVDEKSGTVRLDIVQPRVDGHEQGDIIADAGGWLVVACNPTVAK